MDILLNLIENHTIDAQLLLTGLSILALLLLLLYLTRHPLRYWWEGYRITRAVKRLGARMLRNVNVPDGMDGVINIDFLMLSTDAILIIDVKRYDGMIFGGVQTDVWTQTIDRRNYKFPNPNNYLSQQVSAVKNIVFDAPIKSMHLFIDNAEFPCGKPPNIMQIKDINNSGTRRPKLKNIPAELLAAWQRIMQCIN